MLRASGSVLFFGAIVLSAVSASGQVLKYSTYIDGEDTFAESIAVNGSGDACVSIHGFASTLVKLDSNGSVIYTVTLNTTAGQVSTAIDSQGNCYGVGIGKISATAGVFQSTPKSSDSGQFVIKVDGTGKTIFATYLGGSGTDFPLGITVDVDGTVYVTGQTSSNDYPTLHAFQAALAGADDAFITALNSTGTGLIYSTYWGGASGDFGNAIAVDSAKNAYITGSTSSTDFPIVSPLQDSLVGSHGNAFVTKLDAGGIPVYSTYLGDTGTAGASGLAIAADSNGSAYVTGSAGTGFPLVTPIQSTVVSSSAFVTKLNASGSALAFSTYLGESAVGTGIAVDQARNVYVAGAVTVNSTPPGSIPLASPIQDNFGTGLSDGFVSVLNSSGTTLTFSSYLGGDFDSASQAGIDSAANIYLAGGATGPFPIFNAPNGTYLPLVFDSVNKHFSPSPQAFAMKLSLGPGGSLSFPDTVDFRPDPIAVGNSADATVLLANTGISTNTDISNIVVTGDYSETNNCPPTLSAAANCKFQVTFAPTGAGDRRGTITITDTAPGSPHVINLIGTGLVPQVSLRPKSLAFASQATGTSSRSHGVTLTNSGGAGLEISNIATSGDFSESNNCGTQIGASQRCSIEVVFSPTAIGTRTGVLTITDSASDSPQSASLSGSGTSPSLGLNVPPGSVNSQTVAAGQAATYTLSIGGNGVGGTASLTCMGTPKDANCSLPATETVDAAAAKSFTVTISTMSRSQSAARTGWFGSSWLWAVVIVTVILPSAGASQQRRTLQRCFASLLLISLLCSCGGSTSPINANGTPAGTYNLTINAQSGANVQSATLTLIVN